jgi:hypothetical protein
MKAKIDAIDYAGSTSVFIQNEDSEQTGTGPKNCFNKSGRVYPKLINTCKRKEPRELP